MIDGMADVEVLTKKTDQPAVSPTDWLQQAAVDIKAAETRSLGEMTVGEAALHIADQLTDGNIYQLLPQFDSILDIYERDVTDSVLEEQSGQTSEAIDVLSFSGAIASLLEGLTEDEKHYLPQKYISRLYGFVSRNPKKGIISSQYLPFLLQLDERNRKRDPFRSNKLIDAVKEDIVSMVVNPEDETGSEVAGLMFSELMVSRAVPQDKLQEIFLYAAIRAKSSEEAGRVIRLLASSFTREQIEKIFKAHSLDSPDFQNTARSFLSLMDEILPGDLDNARKQVHPLSDSELLENLVKDLDAVDLSEDIRGAFDKLKQTTGGYMLLRWYLDLRQYADLSSSKINEHLSELSGTEQIGVRIRTNAISQVEDLLKASLEIEEKGSAVVNVYGSRKILYSRVETEMQLAQIYKDLTLLAEDDQMSVEDKMGIADRFLHNRESVEDIGEAQPKTLIFTSRDKGTFVARLTVDGLITAEGAIPDYYGDDKPFESSNVAKAELPYFLDTYGIIRGGKSNRFRDPEPDSVRPDIIIIEVPTPQHLSIGDRKTFLSLLDDYYSDFDEIDRPIVILHCDGFEPQLQFKRDYQGFLFSSSMEELRNLNGLAREMIAQRTKGSEFKPEGLALLQEAQYDASFDLREWEHKTADTYESLNRILDRIQARNRLFAESSRKRNPRHGEFEDGWMSEITQSRPISTILDLGTGEARISGMLARLGYNVMGLDLSETMLSQAQARFKEEGEGLRGEKDDPMLSYNALLRLNEEGLLPRDPITDDAEAAKHLITTKGDFFHLFRDVNNAVKEWHKRCPGVDRDEFFAVSPYDEYAFRSHPEDMFLDAGFDMALFNWHTFCEIGDPSNQREVLSQVLNVLERGGELVIEIPDRMIEPYYSRLVDYHNKHPDLPFGTLQDEKPDGDGMYSARYFPGKEELVLLLKSVGFECDIDKDVQTYFIEEIDPESGKRRMALKELFITARKPTR